MPEQLKPVDVTNAPELLHLAEEVHKTNTPRLLKRGDELLAKVVPVRASKHRTRTAADRVAFLGSAGGWKNLVDADRLIADIRESRRLSSRPPVEL